MMTAKKTIHIKTFGCQMNERDSEVLLQTVCESHQPTDDPDVADLIVLNTCSIRDKAEQKVYSMLGRLRRYKKQKPATLIVVVGCVAQQEGQRILARMAHVDIVLGTGNIHRLPELLARVDAGMGPQVETALSPQPLPSSLAASAAAPRSAGVKNGIKRFVTIMQGCDNFCSYCVVPYTRGRERSRPLDEILEETNQLARAGVREITLLGQNVNSYGKNLAGDVDFPLLLHRVAAIEGITRLRFTTSHPKDLSENLMYCFKDIPKLCTHLHLPVQSGSNLVLEKMGRKYSREDYIEKVARLRDICPDMALSTDIIVGFPGERDEDFAQTMELLESIRFHDAFSFRYSDRPQAKAAGFADKVPEEVKALRLDILQERQREISLARNREYEGKLLAVMVEGKSKNEELEFCGRASTSHVVNFPVMDRAPEVGEIRNILIEEGRVHSLRGRISHD